MKTRIQKWGNSLALRIPKPFAVGTHLQQGGLVDISLVGGDLIVSPVREAEMSLEQMLAGVTEENRHGECEVVPPGLRVAGAILSDQVRNLDWRVRRAELICQVPDEIVLAVLRKLGRSSGDSTVPPG